MISYCLLFQTFNNTSLKMAILFRKKMIPAHILCIINLVIQILFVVSLCHAASSANTTSERYYNSLKLANDTSVKYRNQTLLSTNLKSQPKSRRKRSVIFPTGSDLTFTVSLQFPITALSATSKCAKRVWLRKCSSTGDKTLTISAHPKYPYQILIRQRRYNGQHSR